MDEKRRAARWNVVLPVRYFGATSRHKEGVCKTQDVSVGGARLAMVEKHKIGDRLEMIVEIPQESAPACIDADVVWQKKACNSDEECNYMTGVVFRRIDDCHKSSILGYVSSNHTQEFRRHWWEGCK
jgi:hypothetical protein